MPRKTNRKDYLDYKRENVVRENRNTYSSKFSTNPKGFTKIASGLAQNELDALEDIMDFFGDEKITELFPKDQHVVSSINVIDFCIENRKKCMEALGERFTKVVISENLASPKMKLDQIFNVVENYYDSFYLRHSDSKDLDYFVPSNKAELHKIKMKSYAAIKGNVGVEAVKNEFAKKKKMTFAKFCLEKSKRHVTKLNESIRDLAALKKIDIPDKITNLDILDKVKVAQVQNTVPTYLHMLNESYKSRSAVERFFSYFPFINKAAKEERNSINRIEDMLKNVSYLKFSDEEIKTSVEACAKDNKKDFFNTELKKGNYKPEPKPEPVKQEIEIPEANHQMQQDSKSKKISDIDLQKAVVDKITSTYF